MLFVQQPFSMTATIHGILVCVTFELFRSAEDIIYGNLLPVSEIQINIQRNHRPTPCTSTDSFRTLFLALVNCEPRHTNNVRPNICRFVRVRWNWSCQYPMENAEINTRFFRVEIKAFDTIFHLSLTFRINSLKRKYTHKVQWRKKTQRVTNQVIDDKFIVSFWVIHLKMFDIKNVIHFQLKCIKNPMMTKHFRISRKQFILRHF